MTLRSLHKFSSNVVMLTPHQEVTRTGSISADKETCWLSRLLELGGTDRCHVYETFFFILHFDLLCFNLSLK